ncbi:chemokine XC receptor 1-like [Clarias gariepinus]|uniref:chemokine XC receptor 1-like n=1 Tax=Clarias gariepinus TaxID=13013 RepID=UPI00234C809A|nr:chemokine XC receptor 1-like [Clarias gariepinus]
METKYWDHYNYFKLDSELDRHSEFPIILSIVTLLSLIGNVLVVVISVCCMRLRSLTSIFMLNFALSDLLFTVGLVLRVYHFISGLTPSGAVCKVVHYTFSAGFYSSIMFLVLMSVQQYTTTVHPHSGWKIRRRVACIFVFAWVVSLLAVLPVVIHTVAFPKSDFCMYSSYYLHIPLTYKENIICVCAFLFLSVYYIKILRVIFKLSTNPRHRTTGLAFILVVMFFICWAPYNIVNFLETLTYYQIMRSMEFKERLNYANYICHLLVFIRCCLNPVIYALFGLKYRKSVREIYLRRAPVHSARMETGELPLQGRDSLNNQVPEQDIKLRFS